MKNFILSLSLLLFISISSSGQRLSDIDTNKYSIHLPSYWKPGNKIWEILTDKFPIVCEELKDKELCGDHCNPKYTIEFDMSEPVIYNYYSSHISSGPATESWQFYTVYSFSASLLLFNEKDKLLTQFILVDSTEKWTVAHRAELASYLPSKTPIMYVQNGQVYQSARTSGTSGQTPFSYINNNKEKLSPTQRDMLSVVDEKIRSW